MATTLEDMEKRLAALETEVTFLRQLITGEPIPPALAERGARLLREAQAQQAALSAVLGEALGEAGIVGEPVGVEKLREMMAACGVKPEDNLFSREIIAMRDE
jgi:hypothetical protein